MIEFSLFFSLLYSPSFFPFLSIFITWSLLFLPLSSSFFSYFEHFVFFPSIFSTFYLFWSFHFLSPPFFPSQFFFIFLSFFLLFSFPLLFFPLFFSSFFHPFFFPSFVLLKSFPSGKIIPPPIVGGNTEQYTPLEKRYSDNENLNKNSIKYVS